MVQRAGQTGSRIGVPNGWTRPELEAVLTAQQTISRKIIRTMAEKEIIPDDPRVEEVLTELHAISTAKYTVDPATGKKIPVVKTQDALGFAYGVKERITSAKVFLDFTKTKPTSKIEHSVSAPEDFLRALAEEDKDGSADAEYPSPSEE